MGKRASKKRKQGLALIGKGVGNNIKDTTVNSLRSVPNAIVTGLKTQSVAKGLKELAYGTIKRTDPVKAIKNTGKIIKGVGKMIFNDPQFYTQLGEHTQLVIPHGYVKTNGFDGNLVPTLATHKVYFNYLPDKFQVLQRYSTAFKNIKAIRGLSSVNYSLDTIGAVRGYGLALTLIARVLKKMVKTVNTYRLNSPYLGRIICASYGFDFDEVLANIANYKTLIVNLHANYMANMPILFRTEIEKQGTLVDPIVADCDLINVASYHQFSMKFEYPVSDMVEGLDDISLDFTDVATWTYETIDSQIKVLFLAVQTNQQIQELIADIYGAYGNATKYDWIDSDLDDEVHIGTADALYKNMLKNIQYVSGSFDLYSWTANNRPSINKQVNIVPSLATDADGNAIVDVSSSHTISGDVIMVNPDDAWVSEPSVVAFGAASAVDIDLSSTLRDGVSITVHKDELSEGESLELLELTAHIVEYKVTKSNSVSKFTLTKMYRTHDVCVYDTVISSVTSNGTINTVDFRGGFIYDIQISNGDYSGYLVSSNFVDVSAQWAFVQGMPAVHPIFGTLNYDDHDTNEVSVAQINATIMIDVDSIGDISTSCFNTSIAFSTYSLLDVVKVTSHRYSEGVIEALE